MNAHLMQTLLLSLILLVSALAALRHLLPTHFRRAQGAIARTLSQPRMYRVIRQWGYWIQPDEARKGGCGSGLGCGSCGGCGTTASETTAAIPLKFSQRPIQRVG